MITMTNQNEKNNVNNNEITYEMRSLSSEQMRDYILNQYKDNKEEQNKAMKLFVSKAFTTKTTKEGKEKKVMDIHKARRYFAKTYMPTLIKNKTNSASDLFAEWF